MGYFYHQPLPFDHSKIITLSVWALIVPPSNPNDHGEQNMNQQLIIVRCYFSWFRMSLWTLPKFVMLWFAAHTLNILSFDLSMRINAVLVLKFYGKFMEAPKVSYNYRWSNECCWMSLCAYCFPNSILVFQCRLTLLILVKFVKI